MITNITYSTFNKTYNNSPSKNIRQVPTFAAIHPQQALRTVNCPRTNCTGSFIIKLKNYFKNLYSKLIPATKLPANFNPDTHKETVEKCLEKYLLFFQPDKNQTEEQFKANIKAEFNKYLINEARKANAILEKNKVVFKEMDENYKTSLKQIVKNIRIKKLSLEEARKYFTSAKAKIDIELANKILKLFAKEYNMEELCPEVDYMPMDKTTLGGWDGMNWKIWLDCIKYASMPDLVGTLFHEFTHFRQNVNAIKYFGEKNYLKYAIIKHLKVFSNAECSIPPKYLIRTIGTMIISRPLYIKTCQYCKKHNTKQNKFEKNILEIIMMDKLDYIKANGSVNSYLNQLSEIHAFYNDEYIKELYKKIFPDYADIERC